MKAKLFANGRIPAYRTGRHASAGLFLITGFLAVNLIVTAQSWNQKASLPSFAGNALPRFAAVGFSIGTKGYVGTGYAYTPLQDFWEWDQATNAWTQKANYPGGPRYHATGFSIGNKGYIGIGVSPWMEKDFWEWNQATNTWIKKADFPGTLRYDPVGFSIGNYGYVGTGAGGAPPGFRSFWQWDQAGNTWTRMSDFGGSARTQVAGFSIGIKGYIGTGWDGSTGFKDFWEWDQPGDAWTQKASFPGEARYGAMSFTIGTKGFMGGGIGDKGNALNDYYSWNQASNTWKREADFPGQARGSGIGFSIGDKGYVGLGSLSGGKQYPQNDFWEYGDTTAQIPPCSISVTAFADPASICTGNTIAIYASGGSTYLWNTGATAAHITETPTVTTTYNVTGSNASGCTGNAAITITVQDCATGISEINSSASVLISPNPFNESATVIITGVESVQSHEMKLYDVLGNEVRSQRFTGNQTTLERGTLADGVYFYRIQTPLSLLSPFGGAGGGRAGGEASGKFIISK